MIPAKGFYGLKTGSDEFFRYTAPKIVKCQVYESSQKIFLDEMSAPFPSVILESGTAQMPLRYAGFFCGQY
jgi:hypothetical protein